MIELLNILSCYNNILANAIKVLKVIYWDH